jgi:predicted transposase YdaD
VDTYLRLNVQEEQVFQESVGTLEGTEREGIMQIVTSWMEQGIAEGEQRGRTEEAQALILRQLTRRVGILPPEMRSQVESLPLEELESLGEALLDFSSLADLNEWLRTLGA